MGTIKLSIMKAEDLMIGDWIGWLPTWKNDETGEIEWDGDRNDPIIGKVGMLMKDCTTIDYCDDDYCDESIDVEDIGLIPIPLTPEILEKNGFGFTRNNNTDSVWNGWWIYEGLELAVANLNKEGNWPCFINIYDSNILCEYMHQLQHALRLCGIEKEIVL